MQDGVLNYMIHMVCPRNPRQTEMKTLLDDDGKNTIEGSSLET
jgi:hypothetical protein